MQSTTQLQGQDEPTDIAQVIKQDAVAPSNGILQTLSKFFRISGTSYNPDNTGSPAINYVKWILNMVLGLVSFVALVLVIFAFYLIFFSKDEEGVKKAKKILTGVAIALAIMGLAWFIVSYFFNVFTTVA
ncbi:MAG: pilin [bacterium]